MANRLRHQIAATLLALCVAMSGFVGINPALHRLVEHGGDGSAHTHRGGATFWHDHGDDHPHRREVPVAISFPQVDKRLEHVFQSHPFGSLPVREVLTRLLKSWAGDNASEEPETDHQHRSLAQSLSDGLVESAFTWDARVVHLMPLSCEGTSTRDFFPASDWSPHTASRTPPALLG